ncbi:MAG: HAD family hydrolase [Chloroflexota bacterium]
MITITVPGLGSYNIEYLVLDVNGTIAQDGQLIMGVQEKLALLSARLEIHLITADTHGSQSTIDTELGIAAFRITPGHESVQKGQYVRLLGAAHVVAIGNGANDVDMLRSAAIGIGVLGGEGLASGANQAADILTFSIQDALDLLLNPARISATLRR